MNMQEIDACKDYKYLYGIFDSIISHEIHVVRVSLDQVKHWEGHLGLVLGLVLSLENILNAENMAIWLP